MSWLTVVIMSEEGEDIPLVRGRSVLYPLLVYQYLFLFLPNTISCKTRLERNGAHKVKALLASILHSWPIAEEEEVLNPWMVHLQELKNWFKLSPNGSRIMFHWGRQGTECQCVICGVQNSIVQCCLSMRRSKMDLLYLLWIFALPIFCIVNVKNHLIIFQRSMQTL